MTPGFKGRAMIPPRMVSPVLYRPSVYFVLEDRRLFREKRKDKIFHALNYQESQPVVQLRNVGIPYSHQP
jgi:hypothetical protein